MKIIADEEGFNALYNECYGPAGSRLLRRAARDGVIDSQTFGESTIEAGSLSDGSDFSESDMETLAAIAREINGHNLRIEA